MCDTEILNRICLISKLLESTLIVFIDNGDEEGAEMADELERLDLLANDNYCRVLTTQKLVVVKLLSGSESSRYFSDIYGPIHHSTTFFIKSTTGEVLHVWDGRGRKPNESSTGTIYNKANMISSVASNAVHYRLTQCGKCMLFLSGSPEDCISRRDPSPSVVEPSSSGLHRRKEEDAVLQLRSADGSATTITFPRGATLAAVRDAVVQRLRIAPGTFSIVNPYPRYEFGETDFRRTLQDLRLWPNAVLFISPNSEATSPKPWLEPFSAVFGLLANLFTSFWAFLCMVFNFGRNRNEDVPGVRTKRRKRQGPRIQSQRNIHSLHDADSSSEDNATYNGNSTQQQ